MSMFGKIRSIFSSREAEFEKASDTHEKSVTSIIEEYFTELRKESGSGNSVQTITGQNLFVSIPTEKIKRLALYKSLTDYPEVKYALHETCNGAGTLDANGEVVKLKIKNMTDLPMRKVEEIQEAFKHFINLFNFEDNMFEYMWDLVTEGEICWENKIDDEKPEYGIIGIKKIKNEAFEFAFNKHTFKKEGIMININPDMLNAPMELIAAGARSRVSAAAARAGFRPENNKENINLYNGATMDNLLYIPFSQLTYINTGEYVKPNVVKPILESARKIVNQLNLIESAIIIYRLVRAPERLSFNVGTGKMSASKAQQEVKKLMTKYNQKKVYDPTTGQSSNGYDPHQMLDNYWFIKPEGSEGTTVETIGGGMDMGEIPELEYFQKKLFLTLNIPQSRYFDSQVSIELNDSINAEELRFAKHIMRLNNRMEKGLRDSFLVHLGMLGLFDDDKIKAKDITIQFNPPSLYETQIALEALMKQNECFSIYKDAFELETMNSYAAKKYFDLDDKEIQKIWNGLREDKLRQAKLEQEMESISEGTLEVTFSEPDKNGDVKITTKKVTPPPESEDDY